MKKYSKPEIYIEKFDMDIEILATVEMGTPLYDEYKVLYKRWCFENHQIVSDEGFAEFIRTHSGNSDTPSSGLCYFTPTQPS